MLLYGSFKIWVVLLYLCQTLGTEGAVLVPGTPEPLKDALYGL